MKADSRKIMVYLPDQQSRVVNDLAKKLDRPRSWIIQKAIALSANQLGKLPPPFPEPWKKKFWRALKEVDDQTTHENNAEIESFAVQVVKDYRRKRG